MREQLISVIIAERPYRLNVKSELEEQTFRQAARLINEKMNNYGSNFAFRDKQDLLAMVTLQFAVEHLHMEQESRNRALLMEQLGNIDRILDESLVEKANVL
jgi:cell division protein ZapA (FtsZ GTPase activity inhibitor)